jgi:hypothetical protein
MQRLSPWRARQAGRARCHERPKDSSSLSIRSEQPGHAQTPVRVSFCQVPTACFLNSQHFICHLRRQPDTTSRLNRIRVRPGCPHAKGTYAFQDGSVNDGPTTSGLASLRAEVSTTALPPPTINQVPTFRSLPTGANCQVDKQPKQTRPRVLKLPYVVHCQIAVRVTI